MIDFDYFHHGYRAIAAQLADEFSVLFRSTEWGGNKLNCLAGLFIIFSSLLRYIAGGSCNLPPLRLQKIHHRTRTHHLYRVFLRAFVSDNGAI